MEKDVLLAAGAARTLYEKFYEHSDGYQIHVCKICGVRAIVNEKLGIYRCKKCGDGADIVKVNSSWVANLFFNELSAMGIDVKFDMKPYQFAKRE